MKKILFLITLLTFMGGVNSVKAQAETDITTLTWVNKGQPCTQDFNNEKGGTVYGTDAGGSSISYVDVSAYGIIKLYGTASQTARLFINREVAGDENGTFFVDLDSKGVGTFDCNTVLTKQPKAQYIHLNGVKASAYNTNLNLSSITVSGSAIEFPEPDPFVLLDGEVEINTLPWVNQGQGCANNLGTETDAPIYGTDAGPSDGNLSYVDATDYTAVKLFGPDGTVRLFINRAEYGGGTFQFYVTISGGVGVLDLADVYAAQDGATYIHINGVKASTPGAKAQVDHITLVEKPFEFPEGVTDLTTLPYVNEAQGCVNNLGTSTDATIYGTDAGPDGSGNLSYIDVTNYSAIKLYGAAGDVVRLFINRAEYGTYQFFVTIGEDGVGTLNLANVYAAQSGATYVHLNGLKASQTWATTPDADGKALVNYIGVVNAISVTAGPAPYSYVLTGAGELTVPATRALADANATFYDATGVTGTDVDLTSVANSNALFKANSGALANTSNVIVGSTCANLALKDGNYPFSAPETFTATSVSFNRTFKAGTRSTVCLPFALTAAEAAEAGTFYELSGTENEGTQLTFTDITASGTTAYKPYIFEANADGAPFSSAYANKEIAETPATFTGTTVEGYTLTGVLTGSTDVAADHAGKKVYGWSANSGKEGTFVKVGSGVSIDPFRAYVVYNGSGNNARLAARFVGGSVTGINEVSEAQGFNNFEGKVFENGKIVIYKKGMKFNANGARLK